MVQVVVERSVKAKRHTPEPEWVAAQEEDALELVVAVARQNADLGRRERALALVALGELLGVVLSKSA